MSDTSALLLLMAVFFGWLGYRSSLAFRATRGVTPWHVPSFVWALICFLFTVLGLVLELVAQLTTRPSQQLGTPPGQGRQWRSTFSMLRPPSATHPAAPGAGGPGSASSAGASSAGAGAGRSQPPTGTDPARGYGLAGPGSTDPYGSHGLPTAPQLADIERVPRWPKPPAGPNGAPAGFGWYGDPAGRHEMRYFDGRGWTHIVRDGNVRGEDPLER